MATIAQGDIPTAVQGDVVVYDDGLIGLVGADGVARTKTGLSSMNDLARLCCKITATFGPYLRQNLPNSAAIIILLDIIDLLCRYLQSQIDAIKAQQDYVADGVSLDELRTDLQRIGEKLAEATQDGSAT